MRNCDEMQKDETNSSWAGTNRATTWSDLELMLMELYRRYQSFAGWYVLFNVFFCAWRSSASSTNRSSSAEYDNPVDSHSLAYMLIEVKPGIVFNSFSQTRLFRRPTKKSTRAIPAQSIVRKAWTAIPRIFDVTRFGSIAGMKACDFPSTYLAS